MKHMSFVDKLWLYFKEGIHTFRLCFWSFFVPITQAYRVKLGVEKLDLLGLRNLWTNHPGLKIIIQPPKRTLCWNTALLAYYSSKKKIEILCQTKWVLSHVGPWDGSRRIECMNCLNLMAWHKKRRTTYCPNNRLRAAQEVTDGNLSKRDPA